MSSTSAREALAVEIERHIQQEEAILRDYHALSDKLPDGLLGVLVNQIVTEEEMHHFLLRSLVEWLRDPEKSEEAPWQSGADVGAVLEQTRSLLEHEIDSIQTFSALSERLEEAGGDALAGLLDAIVLDSRKHHALLSLIEKTVAG